MLGVGCFLSCSSNCPFCPEINLGVGARGCCREGDQWFQMPSGHHRLQMWLLAISVSIDFRCLGFVRGQICWFEGIWREAISQAPG